MLHIRVKSLGLVAAGLVAPMAVAALTMAGPTLRAQAPAQGSAQAELPPVSYTCVMHPEVLEAEEGSCPICKMDLVPVRLVNVYTCPRHAVIQRDQPGQCPIDHLELVRVIMALSFTCPGHPEIDQIDPGTCPDGKPMTKKYTVRPHGNHNPQHGGQFFMASDQWHHIEGSYPAAGRFRLYLYDDFTKPLPMDQAKAVKARVVTEETYDAATRTTKEITAFPLALKEGSIMEASVGGLTLPAKMTVKAVFKPGGPEERFDFTFEELSKEPPPGSAPAGATPSPGARLERQAPRGLRIVPVVYHPAPRPFVPAWFQAPALTASKPPPPTAAGIMELIEQHNSELKDFIDRGVFNEIWVPALNTKDVAVYLEDHLDELPQEQREPAISAAARLVRASWLLDAVGDLGNRPQIVDAYSEYTAALADLETYFPGK